MKNHPDYKKYNLTQLAREAMMERDLSPDYGEEVWQELAEIQQAAAFTNKEDIRDLRDLLFFSIDNVDSYDLDQLSYAKKLPNGHVRIYIAIADVDALVPKGSHIDAHAHYNTTSVYTPTKIFAMLPEKLSNNLTSLNEGVDRLAYVREIEINTRGAILAFSIYRACVQNKKKLDYDSVAKWLEDPATFPLEMRQIRGLLDQLLLHDEITQKMKKFRHVHGALSLETIEAQPIVQQEEVIEIKERRANRATEIIENFMIAANEVTTRYLDERGFLTFRRVVRVPKNWERIVLLAKDLGFTLPLIPESIALEEFLQHQRQTDPVTFPDISLAVVKLLGKGEYVVNIPGQAPVGHFGLAVKNYSHSTAPNRRYPDLITQRLLKAALGGKRSPYSKDELTQLASHCTAKENDAEKVERKIKKTAAAIYLSTKINHSFNAIVTGIKGKETWIRIFHPPVDGKLLESHNHLEVGDRLKVKLVHVDIPHGFIDFVQINRKP